MNYHIRSGSWLKKIVYFSAMHFGYPKMIIEHLELPTSKTEGVSVAFIGCKFTNKPVELDEDAKKALYVRRWELYEDPFEAGCAAAEADMKNEEVEA